MKLLVTGGAGFIGSNFVRYVAESKPGFKVLNLDKLTYAGNLENLSGLENSPDYSFSRTDICDNRAVESCFEDFAPDALVNFAAETHVDRSIEGAQIFIDTNVSGTLSLLEAARKAGTGTFLQVSTDEVYGSLGEGGFFTETSPIQPNSPYAASKAAADMLVRAFGKTHDMDVRITRCSNNYGPYQFPEKLIPLVMTNALEGKRLPVYGDGLQVRDWLYVTDHCRAIIDVLEKGKPGDIYNIGGENEKTNLDTIRTIIDQVGASRELIEFVKDRPGHDRRYAIDPSRIKRELGWTPQMSFEEGIKLTIDWYMNNRQWWESIKSGQYQEYYRKMYGDR